MKPLDTNLVGRLAEDHRALITIEDVTRPRHATGSQGDPKLGLTCRASSRRTRLAASLLKSSRWHS